MTGVRSTAGAWSFFCSLSSRRCICLAALTPLRMAKALDPSTAEEVSPHTTQANTAKDTEKEVHKREGVRRSRNMQGGNTLSQGNSSHDGARFTSHT